MLRPARIMLLVLSAILAIASVGCAPDSPDAGSDQMHGSAPLTSATVTRTAPATEEDSMYHTSDTVVTGSEIGVIETSKGTIRVSFYADDAPNTVASFIELADAGYYDGLKFHRVVPRFVVQGGDPLTRTLTEDDVKAGIGGVGTGGPGWTQKAEFNSRKHVEGTLAMARAQDPDSAGSQFYICLEPQPSLDNKYTVFGQVIEGMDVVNAIGVGDTIVSIAIER